MPALDHGLRSAPVARWSFWPAAFSAPPPVWQDEQLRTPFSDGMPWNRVCPALTSGSTNTSAPGPFTMGAAKTLARYAVEQSGHRSKVKPHDLIISALEDWFQPNLTRGRLKQF